MKIRRLEVRDFRQFYGEQTVDFSTDDAKNVTIIYGSNGSGKTTVLNAFTWGLYGQTTPGLDEGEWCVSNRRWAEASEGDSLEASVTITFEDQGKTYTARRVQRAIKRNGRSSSIVEPGAISLTMMDETGASIEVPNPTGAINAILPERLSRFVFFDGERDIEHLAKPEAVAEIEDGTKTVLGLEIVERAIQHIKKARSDQLNKDVSKFGDSNDAELVGEIEDLDSKLASEREALKEHADEARALSSELEDLNKTLSELEAAQALQARRLDIENTIDRWSTVSRNEIDQIDVRLRNSGYLAFLPGLIDEVSKKSAGLKDTGQIPSPIKQQFVKKLITDGVCICGTSLAEHSPQQEEVMGWLEKAGLPDVEERWVRMGATAESLLGARDAFYQELRTGMRDKSVADTERRRAEAMLSEIDADIANVDDAEVQSLNQRREWTRSQIEKEAFEQGAISSRIKDLSTRRDRAQAELEKAQAASGKGAEAKQRVAVATEVERALTEFLDLKTAQTREELDSAIKTVFGDMCIKPFTPALAEDFRLTLSSTIGGEEIPVAKSTGESQILALSFVGSMARIARERYERAQAKSSADVLTVFQGGVFPLVLDAVFGSLDEMYQDGVAKALPELAPQVIVLVSKKQADTAVQKELWPRAGRAYVCVVHSSGEKAEAQEVSVLGKSVPYVEPVAADLDSTEIREVT